MRTSYLEAHTYGIGQLITQRKLFEVPEHQRDFAWGVDDVEQFFDDIANALEYDAPDYFIGLIVLLGPRKNVWQILDGQQRLATVTMIYSAIRYWLSSRPYDEDAKQIESEFIGVRQLGGTYSPRLTMNLANRDAFLEMVVEKRPENEIDARFSEIPKYSSNRLLVEATVACRGLVNDFATRGASSIEDQAVRLFNLSSYLETRVKAVVLDVSSEVNAFVIFESLNARGNELSVLDLVKNHVFGQAGLQRIEEVREHWMRMAERIEDKNADDFLKVYWTSRFGRVQKPELYKRIKSEFNHASGAVNLASELATTSEHYVALDDPNHEIWNTYGPLCRRRIEILIILGNRQVRAPIMSAIDVFNQRQMEFLLWSLIVLTVRYQVVGRRRTGALEIACARVANMIHKEQIRSDADFWGQVRSITPTDDEFRSDFLRFSERKVSRAAYFLFELEMTIRRNQEIGFDDVEKIAYPLSDLSTDFILPKNPVGDWQQIIELDPDLLEEWLYRLGNRCLLERELADSSPRSLSFEQKASGYYEKSTFLLTKAVDSEGDKWGRMELEKRQEVLADLALKTWRVAQHEQERE